MTDPSHHKFDQSKAPWRSADLGPLPDTHNWVGRYSSAIHDLNTQWLDFFHKRVAEDFALPQHLVSCAIEAWSTCAEFLQTRSRRISKEFCRAGKLRQFGEREADMSERVLVQ